MPVIPFNTARGPASTLQMSPPFAFNDVTMSVFPLRAGLPRLEAFCENYLNQASHIVQFRPFIPFVYLVILDYGRMSLEAANMGWVSQREVAFGIPLRWLNAKETGLEFHDWAFTSPFIFVDNEMSMSTGREVYGWPKLLARLDPSVSEWVRDPHGARRVFQVSTKRAARAYSGEKRDYHTFLSVMQHRTAGMLDLPPNMDTIVKPVAQLSSAAAGMTRLSMDLMRTFTGMASDGITGSSVLPDVFDLETFRSQLKPEQMKSWMNPRKWMPGIKDVLWSMFPRFYANTVNFKQFRDAHDPVAACYQAITAAKMPVKSLKRGGLLGPQNMLLGQIDGGYRIDVHHLAGLPIVDSLGLEVADERSTNGTTISSLAPVCPFWLEVDMSYGLADTVVWRGRRGAWRPGEAFARKPDPPPADAEAGIAGTVAETSRKSGEQASQESENPDDTELQDEDPINDSLGLDYLKAMNFFNTARGASMALGGGFSMPNAAVRILPIKADPEKLSAFARTYLKVEGHMRFEAWGDFVYMIVAEFEQMTSEVNAISTTRAREINFAVPVKCYQWFDDADFPQGEANPHEDMRRGAGLEWQRQRYLRGAQHMVTTGFVVPFSYVDDVGNAITSSEVRGIPTVRADIESPANDWLQLDHSRSQVHRSLLATSAQVLPALMAGAESEKRTLIELHTHSPPGADMHESEHVSVTRWVELLGNDLTRKLHETAALAPPAPGNAKAGVKACFPKSDHGADPTYFGRGFALKLLAGEASFNQFSLKQFRDSKHTDNACYQGLVMNRHVIGNLRDLREIDDTLHVSITDYPTQPITEILGLVPKFTYPGSGRTVKVFEALRPFSMRADLYREAGVTLFERAGQEDWSAVDFPMQIFGRQSYRGDQIVQDIIANADRFDDGCHSEISYEWKPHGKPAYTPVRFAPVTSRFIRVALTRHAARGEIRNLVLNERLHFGEVSVLAEEKLIDAIGRGRAPDLAGYSAQLRESGHETKFKVSEIAGGLELFSPSMITDIVLSEQWGLAAGTKRQDYQKNWFCYRSESIDRHYAAKLFPEAESHAGTWPMTPLVHESQIRRRSSEILGFISEFWAVIEFLGAMLDMNIGETGPYDPDMDKKLRKRPKKPQSEFYDLALKTVPNSFRQDTMSTRIFKDPNISPYQWRPAADWAKLKDAISTLLDLASGRLSEDFKEAIDDFRDRWIALAESSRAEMEIIEFECTKHGHADNLEFYYLQFQDEILRNRLTGLATGGVLKRK